MTAPVQPQAMSAARLATLLALVQAQAASRKQLRDAAAAAAVAAFEGVTNWWDPSQISKAVATTLKLVQPYQVQAARLADAYVARSATMMTGSRTSPVGAVDITKLRRAMPQQVIEDLVAGRVQPAYLLLGELDVANRRVIAAETMNAPAVMAVPNAVETPLQRVRRVRAEAQQAVLEQAEQKRATAAAAVAQTIDPGEPYGRVAEQYRLRVVAKGVDGKVARIFALTRIAAAAQTDITLAVREQWRATMGNIRGITGYRRILHPESSQTGPCGLCVVAADRVYHVQDLKPIHDGCCCETLPVIGDLDPGLFLNRSDLDAIYAEAGGTGGEVIKGGKRHSGRLKNMRVALAENGELGPVLVDADRHFRGPREVALTKTVDKRARLEHQLEGWETEYGRLIRRQQNGEDVDQPLHWQEKRITELRRELASV